MGGAGAPMRFSLILLGVAGAVLSVGPALAQADQGMAGQTIPGQAIPGQAIDLEGQGLALSVSLSAAQPGRPQVGRKARGTGRLDQLQTHIELGTETGQPTPGQGPNAPD